MITELRLRDTIVELEAQTDKDVRTALWYAIVRLLQGDGTIHHQFKSHYQSLVQCAHVAGRQDFLIPLAIATIPSGWGWEAQAGAGFPNGCRVYRFDDALDGFARGEDDEITIHDAISAAHAIAIAGLKARIRDIHLKAAA